MNEEGLQRIINFTNRLIGILNRRKLAFLGHVLRSDSLEKKLIMGMVMGHRGRGTPD